MSLNSKCNHYTQKLVFSLVLLALPSTAQPWSGILNASRAINWQRANVGVAGGIPTTWPACTSGQAGVTVPIAAYSGAATTIINAVAACASANPTGSYLSLASGTFSLTGGISIAVSNVIVRGAGPKLTQLNFSDSGVGGIFSGAFYIATTLQTGATVCGTGNTCPGQQNAADWTGGFSQGATSITLANVGAIGILNGDYIILDQRNEVTDNNGFMQCDNGGNGTMEQGVTFSCMPNNGQPTGNTGRVIGGVPYAQEQMVQVTSGCSTACNSSGPYTLTISPGLYENNWNQGNAAGNVGAWFVKPISYVGVENLAIDNSACPDTASCQSGISFLNVANGWVKNVRIAKTRRNHVWMVNSTRMELRDSYLYNARNAASQSYGLECFGCDDFLVENNIVQQTAGPYVMAGCAGGVFGYNFAIDNVQWPPSFQQSDLTVHSNGCDMILLEGNQGQSFISDNLHGTTGKIGGLRNALKGQGYNTCTSGAGTCTDFNNFNNLTTQQTYPIDFDAYNRGYWLVGNILGTASYHTTYEAAAPTSFTGAQCFLMIYTLGYGGGECDNLAANGVLDDTKVKSTLFRWGNYDTVNAAVRWDNTESSPGSATYLTAMTTPSSHTLPASFYLSSMPLFFNVPSGVTAPFPPIGPDVTGGTGPAGMAYTIPAANCYYNILSGPTDGSGNALAFDANLCYYASGGGGVRPAPVTGVKAVVGNGVN